MDDIDFTATVIASCTVSGGRFELVEWHWPDMVSFEQTQQQLMLEMSLPPMAADASAYFPDIDPERRCFMGALFVRHPGVAIGGRSEGRQIRVIRCLFDEQHGAAIIGTGAPSLPFLQGLLNIRNDALRSLMRLAHRELINPLDRSSEAMEALFQLVRVELGRVFHQAAPGRAKSSPASSRKPGKLSRVRGRIERRCFAD